jgi:saccharopine dehydrogenase-like NADP-dependent oxidoreductase
MKVVVLGGAGDMGSQAVRTIAASSLVKELVIADYRLVEAEKLAAEFPGKARARFLDAREGSSLAQALEGAAVAVNCVGPFYQFARSITEAAIAARVHLADICDDYDGLARVLDLHDRARAAGVVVLTGIGWTPGLSNLLAAEGARGLQAPVDIAISWVGTAADSKGKAVLKHLLHAIDGDVPMVLEGKLVQVPARSGRESVDFPPPIGSATVSYCGHPEPLTLTRAVPAARTVTVKGGLKPDWVNSVGSAVAAMGLCRTGGRKDFAASVLHRIEFLFRGAAAELSAVRVDVTGTCDGRRVTRTRAVADRMARLTGIPVAIATLLLLERRIERKGVCAPEEAVPVPEFFRRLRAEGIETYEWEED